MLHLIDYWYIVDIRTHAKHRFPKSIAFEKDKYKFPRHIDTKEGNITEDKLK